MRDDNPMVGALSILAPAALALTVLWVLLGDTARDAVFAVLKLVVTR